MTRHIYLGFCILVETAILLLYFGEWRSIVYNSLILLSCFLLVLTRYLFFNQKIAALDIFRPTKAAKMYVQELPLMIIFLPGLYVWADQFNRAGALSGADEALGYMSFAVLFVGALREFIARVQL